MTKDNDKKTESILDPKVWDEAAEMMERNQKSQTNDSDTFEEQKENDDDSVLGKIKNWFK